MARMMTVNVRQGKTVAINPAYVVALHAERYTDSTCTVIELNGRPAIESVEEPHVIKQKWEAANG